MNSNMQDALLAPAWICFTCACFDLRPSLSMMTISPGSTSLTKPAPMISRAQLSDARTYPSSDFPRWRPQTIWILMPIRQSSVIHEGISAPDHVHGPLYGINDAFAAETGDKIYDDLGINSRLKDNAVFLQAAPQLGSRPGSVVASVCCRRGILPQGWALATLLSPVVEYLTWPTPI